MALHQVKIFKPNGKLKKIVPSEKLFLIGDDFNGGTPEPKKAKGIIIHCIFCGAKATSYQASRTTCKRSVCKKKEREKKKANKLKLKRGSYVSNS